MVDFYIYIIEMIKFLNKIYPLNLFSFRTTLFFGLFITLFLFIFQPFGINSISNSNKFWLLLGYGFVTFLSVGFNQYVIPRIFPFLFKEKHWTILFQIIWLLWNIFFVATLNFYYSFYLIETSVDLKTFSVFIVYTLVTGTFPVIILTILTHNRLLKNNLKRASELNKELHTKNSRKKSNEELTLFASNRKDKVNLIISNLLFVESFGNYITIRWYENEMVNEKTIRNTLKDIEIQLKNFDSILRIHKSFLINLNQIKEVKGNAQGYKLVLNKGKNIVPVSRNFIKIFNTKFNKF